jgi:hypothetical protein
MLPTMNDDVANDDVSTMMSPTMMFQQRCFNDVSTVHFGLRGVQRIRRVFLSRLDRHGGLGDRPVEFSRGPVFVAPWVEWH